MATNLALNDELIVEVQRIGHFKSKRDAVNTAMAEYVQRHKQSEIIDLFGEIDIDVGYDHKDGRK